MLKEFLLLIAACSLSMGAMAKGGSHSGGSRSGGGHVNSSSHSVRGHVTKKGTYVAPSRSTNPNGRRSDNYSHKGSVNPYTDKEGIKN